MDMLRRLISYRIIIIIIIIITATYSARPTGKPEPRIDLSCHRTQFSQHLYQIRPATRPVRQTYLSQATTQVNANNLQ